MASQSSEEYLEALYTLTEKAAVRASTTKIALRLGVAPASATEMLQKLAVIGLVDYSPYHGANLTKKGFQQAEKMVRRHRLLERFLHDVLRIKKDRVHEQACELEHALSDETESALCRFLKSPSECPGKSAIPPCDLNVSSCSECPLVLGKDLEEVGQRKENLLPLVELKERVPASVAFIRGDNKTIKRLLDLGLTPGVQISVERVAPASGPVQVLVRGSKLAIGRSIASNVFVELSG